MLIETNHQHILKEENDFAFNSPMTDVYVKVFNHQTFNQDEGKSVILKINYLNPPHLKFQNLLFKEEKLKLFKLVELGFIVDVLTSVGFQEIVKIGGKVIQTFEGIINRENFKKS